MPFMSPTEQHQSTEETKNVYIWGWFGMQVVTKCRSIWCRRRQCIQVLETQARCIRLVWWCILVEMLGCRRHLECIQDSHTEVSLIQVRDYLPDIEKWMRSLYLSVWLQFGVSGNSSVWINIAALCRAWLMLEWVTVCRQVNRLIM